MKTTITRVLVAVALAVPTAGVVLAAPVASSSPVDSAQARPGPDDDPRHTNEGGRSKNFVKKRGAYTIR